MKNGFEKNLSIFMAGALLGGAVAVLTAPYSGRRMRRIVRHKIEDSTGQLTDIAERLSDICEELYARSGKLVHETGKKLAQVSAIGH